MANYDASTELVVANIQTLDDIKNALTSLGNIDADFNGDNGVEYLWDGVDENDFQSNAEYLADKIVYHSNITDGGIKAFADAFANEWFDHDGYYYSDIIINVAKLGGNADDPDMTGVYALSICATSRV